MPAAETRFIFITGGVVSSLGKGIAAASIGRSWWLGGLMSSFRSSTRTSTSTRARCRPTSTARCS